MPLQMWALRQSLKIITNPLLTRHFKFDHVIHTMTIIHYVSLKIPVGAPASGAPPGSYAICARLYKPSGLLEETKLALYTINQTTLISDQIC